jgi:hypothetical protein
VRQRQEQQREAPCVEQLVELSTALRELGQKLRG